MWLDPPQQSDFQFNDAITVHMTFADRMTHLVLDPDIVNFNYTNPPVNTTPTSLTYPASITKDGVGAYHIDLILNGEGRWVLNVQPQGNPGAVSVGMATMEVFVYGNGL